MFKHILLPTDGSKLSGRAVKIGIDFAKKTRARVTAIHVVPEFTLMVDDGITMLSPDLKKRFEDEGIEVVALPIPSHRIGKAH